jgi:hypothetical protein
MKLSLTNERDVGTNLTTKTILNITTTSLIASLILIACLAHTCYEIRRCYCSHFLPLSTPKLATFTMFAWGCVDMLYVGVMEWVIWKNRFVLPGWGYILAMGAVYGWTAVVWVDGRRAEIENWRRGTRTLRTRWRDMEWRRADRRTGWRTARRWWM